MTRFITTGSIILMLMLFSSLSAESSSKNTKRNSSSDKEQKLEQEKAKQEEKEQKASRKQINKTESVKQEKIEKEKSVQREREQAAQPVKEKTNHTESIQREQSNNTQSKPENNKPAQSTPARASQNRNNQFEQLRFLKTNQTDIEPQTQIINKKVIQNPNIKPVSNVTNQPVNTEMTKPGRVSDNSTTRKITELGYASEQVAHRGNPATGNNQLTPMNGTVSNQPLNKRPHPNDNDNPPPNDNDHPNNHGDNGNHGHHGGWGDPFNHGWHHHHHHYWGYGPYAHHGYGWYDYSYYWQSGLTIYFVIDDEMEEFKGYLVDNSLVDYEYAAIDLRYRSNPYFYSNIHKHTTACPEGGYGLMVRLQNGEYAYFHLDEYGSKKARKLYNNPRNYNQKVYVDVTGILNLDNHTIEVLTLKKAGKTRSYYFVGYFPLPRDYYRPYYSYNWWDVHPYRNRNYHRYHRSYYSYNW